MALFRHTAMCITLCPMLAADRPCIDCQTAFRWNGARCRDCHRAHQRTLAARRPKRRAQWRFLHGEELAKAQAALPLTVRCACCWSPSPRRPSTWIADHDHTTGRFRGFVCHPCNIVIGFMEKYGLEMSTQVAKYLGEAR